MKINQKYIFLLLLMISSLSYSQKKQDRYSYAEKELIMALKKNKQHNVIDNKTIIIKDSVTAINVAEPILFGIYGKENIIKQKPFEIYNIDNHWVIYGTQSKNTKGGIFTIILDAKNSKIIKLTHSK